MAGVAPQCCSVHAPDGQHVIVLDADIVGSDAELTHMGNHARRMPG
jgi:hypothetical protein